MEIKINVKYRLNLSEIISLFVVDNNNVINFPMGTTNLADSGCLKSTSLRELAELSLYIWSIDKLSDLKNFAVKGFISRVKKYIINEFHYFCSH